MIRRGAIGGAALLALLWAETVVGESWQQAMADAYEQNPALAGARADWRASWAQIGVARAARLPNIQTSASLGYLRANEWTYLTADFPNVLEQSRYRPRSLAVNASQPLYHGGALKAAQRAAQAQAAAQKAQLRATEQQVLAAVGQACADLIKADAALTLAREYVAALERAAQGVEAKLRFHDATRTDLAQAQSRLAQAQAQVSQAQAQLASARMAFEASVGRPPQAIPAPLTLATPVDTEAAALEMALAQHPDIDNARYGLEAAEANLQTAQGNARPSLDLTASYSTAAETSSFTLRERTFEIGAKLSYPVYAGGSFESKIRQGDQQLLASRFSLEDQQAAVRAQVHQAWQEWKTSDHLLQARQRQVQATQRSYQGVVRQFNRGYRTFLDTLDALRDAINARSQLLSAENGNSMARLSLLSAMGVLTAEHLQLPLSPHADAPRLDEAVIGGGAGG
jgi:outer membrane protein